MKTVTCWRLYFRNIYNCWTWGFQMLLGEQ